MCKKRKYDKLGTMFALSQCKRVGNYNSLRNERRYTIVVNVTLII